MGIEILNLMKVGLNILVLFILMVTVGSGAITGPQKEVVSIYNEDFTTPSSRYPYFIEVYRCVKVVLDDDHDECGSDKYPVQGSMTEIEIVVPDLGNKDRDPTYKNKYYRYVVYNHTSCKCVGPAMPKDRKLYNATYRNESEQYFKTNYRNNPDNLRSHCNYCSSPQQRYKLHTEHGQAESQFKYLAYQQCLPGCVVTSHENDFPTTSMTHGSEVKVPITNDITCKPYDISKIAHAKKQQRVLKEDTGNSLDQERNYELLVHVGSGKIILAAFLLSLVLFTILIMDFTLCRRKKGLFYALFSCKNSDMDNVCQHCTERSRNEITV